MFVCAIIFCSENAQHFFWACCAMLPGDSFVLASCIFFFTSINERHSLWSTTELSYIPTTFSKLAQQQQITPPSNGFMFFGKQRSNLLALKRKKSTQKWL